jgi:hypothetical protein
MDIKTNEKINLPIERSISFEAGEQASCLELIDSLGDLLNCASHIDNSFLTTVRIRSRTSDLCWQLSFQILKDG